MNKLVRVATYESDCYVNVIGGWCAETTTVEENTQELMEEYGYTEDAFGDHVIEFSEVMVAFPNDN